MLAPGTMLAGRFEVTGELGRGGHGVVYRGKQHPLGREVAIKVLLEESATPEMLGRFGREVGLVQRLQHPNTVRLYDFGTTDGGLPFMVFELLEGRSLDQELRTSGPLSPIRVAKVAVQILNALSEAHALGVVHRDIKPANVLIVDYAGEPDFVKLLDFGVARSILQAPQNNAITRQGQLVGTPAYMAPELVRDEPMTPATDIYALGLLMAEALTGKPVFAGPDVVVWLAQASDALPPLPDAVTHTLLGPVIDRATRKKVRERYGSAEEMIAEIERCVSNEELAPTDPLAKPIEVAPRTERLPAPSGHALPPPTPLGHAHTAPAPLPATPRRWPMFLIVTLLVTLTFVGAWSFAPRGRVDQPLKAIARLEPVEIGPLGRELGLAARLDRTGWSIVSVMHDSSGFTTESYRIRGARYTAVLAVTDLRPVTAAAAYVSRNPTICVHKDRLLVQVFAVERADVDALLEAIGR